MACSDAAIAEVIAAALVGCARGCACGATPRVTSVFFSQPSRRSYNTMGDTASQRCKQRCQPSECGTTTGAGDGHPRQRRRRLARQQPQRWDQTLPCVCVSALANVAAPAVHRVRHQHSGPQQSQLLSAAVAYPRSTGEVPAGRARCESTVAKRVAMLFYETSR